MTGWRDFLRGRRAGRSAELEKTSYEGKAEDDAVDGPSGRDRSTHPRSDGHEQEPANAQQRSNQSDCKDGAEHSDVIQDFGFETMHGGYSLVLSAIAAMVLAVVNLVEPGHMHLEHVFGGLLGYFVGVPVCFALDRRLHRRKRAIPVPDPFGTGRLALTVMAAVFCVLGSEEASRLAGWIAFSALVLGGLADGAWLSLVAGRRGVGLWGALRGLQASVPTAQQRHWAALFGEKRR